MRGPRSPPATMEAAGHPKHADAPEHAADQSPSARSGTARHVERRPQQPQSVEENGDTPMMSLVQEMVFVRVLSGKTAMLPVPPGQAVAAVLAAYASTSGEVVSRFVWRGKNVAVVTPPSEQVAAAPPPDLLE
jgi:hypothetical protein